VLPLTPVCTGGMRGVLGERGAFKTLNLNSEVEPANQRFLDLANRDSFSGCSFGDVEFWHGKLLSRKEKLVSVLCRLRNSGSARAH